MLFRQTKKQEQSELIKDDAFYRKHPKIMRLWLVEITSTDSEVLQFYVSGMTQFDAYEKADGYSYWMTNEKLKNKLSTFRLMP
jgi:hypothetical protein